MLRQHRNTHSCTSGRQALQAWAAHEGVGRGGGGAGQRPGAPPETGAGRVAHVGSGKRLKVSQKDTVRLSVHEHCSRQFQEQAGAMEKQRCLI